MKEKATRTAGPATHPNWDMAQASESTPDPITAVMICALAVTKVPSNQTRTIKNKNNGLSLLIHMLASVCRIPVRLTRPSSSKFLLGSISNVSGVCSTYMLFFSNSVISLSLCLCVFVFVWWVYIVSVMTLR